MDQDTMNPSPNPYLIIRAGTLAHALAAMAGTSLPSSPAGEPTACATRASPSGLSAQCPRRRKKINVKRVNC